MVYAPGMDPSYSPRYCDLCKRTMEANEDCTRLKLRITHPMPKNGPEGGLDEHEGHICSVCDDVADSMGVEPPGAFVSVTYNYFIDEDNQPELLYVEFVSKGGGPWRLPPQRVSDRIHKISDYCLTRIPGIDYERDVDPARYRSAIRKVGHTEPTKEIPDSYK